MVIAKSDRKWRHAKTFRRRKKRLTWLVTTIVINDKEINEEIQFSAFLGTIGIYDEIMIHIPHS